MLTASKSSKNRAQQSQKKCQFTLLKMLMISALSLMSLGCGGMRQTIQTTYPSAPDLLMREPIVLSSFYLKKGEPLQLSDILQQHNIEVVQCKQTEQQLMSLQHWVLLQSMIKF